MRTFRFTIAGLLGLVLIFGVGFAALKDPTETWARAISGLAIAAVAGAAVGARLRQRPGWATFATLGLIALALLFGPWTPWLRLAPAVDRGLERLYPRLHPDAEDRRDAAGFRLVRKNQAGNGRPSPVKLSRGVTSVQPVTARFKAVTEQLVDGSRVQAGSPLRKLVRVRYLRVLLLRPGAPDAFLRIGRALLALMVAGLGGLLVPWLLAIVGRRRATRRSGPWAPPGPSIKA